MGSKTILGLTEKITLLGEGTEESVAARIDTGATSSSIDETLARRLNLKAGRKLRIVKSAHGIKKRPLAVVRIKLDGTIIEEEFTLVDRSHMTYPVLIGQNILKKGDFLIDPHKKTTSHSDDG